MKFDHLKSYQRHFSKLIQLERNEEMERQKHEIDSFTGEQRQRKGRALLDLSGKDAGPGIGGACLVKFSRHQRFPKSEISVGDVVIVSKGDPTGNEEQAVVVEKGGKYILVSYANIPPGYVYGHRLRLDLHTKVLWRR